MTRPPRTHIALRTSLLAALLAAFVVAPPSPDRVHADAASILRTAWQRTERVGRYAFETRLTQTTLPPPAITSAGRQAKVTTLFMDGTADRRAQRLELSLWRDGAAIGDPAEALEVRIDGVAASARVKGGEWQALDDIDGGLAQTGDAASFLVAAEHVRPLGAETRALPTASGTTREVSFERYAFALDGEAYATYMRDLTTDYLRSHGELPAGVRLGTVDRFMNVATRGEAWIDGDGLPLRMTLTMEHPQARDGTRTTVEVQTDFTGYGDAAAAAGAVGAAGDFWTHPLAWVADHAPGGATAAVATSLAADTALFVLVLALGYALLALRRRRPRLAYQIVATVMVAHLTVMPLVQTALTTRQMARFLERFPPAGTAHAAEANDPTSASTSAAMFAAASSATPAYAYPLTPSYDVAADLAPPPGSPAAAPPPAPPPRPPPAPSSTATATA